MHTDYTIPENPEISSAALWDETVIFMMLLAQNGRFHSTYPHTSHMEFRYDLATQSLTTPIISKSFRLHATLMLTCDAA